MGGASTLQECRHTVRVLVADDTRMGCQVLVDALRHCHHLEVIGAASSDEVFNAVTDHQPQVVVLNAHLDDDPQKGFKVCRKLHSSPSEIKVVILLDSSRRDLVVEAFRAGAKGVFSRAGSIKALCKCIISVYNGQTWANTNEMEFLLAALAESAPLKLVDAKGKALLSKRELDVVRAVADGLTNREVSAQLKLSEHTVKNYLFRIFDKLGVSSRVEMILYVFSQLGLAQNSTVAPERNGGFS